MSYSSSGFRTYSILQHKRERLTRVYFSVYGIICMRQGLLEARVSDPG
jgi:hypothetical protein